MKLLVVLCFLLAVCAGGYWLYVWFDAKNHLPSDVLSTSSLAGLGIGVVLGLVACVIKNNTFSFFLFMVPVLVLAYSIINFSTEMIIVAMCMIAGLLTMHFTVSILED